MDGVGLAIMGNLNLGRKDIVINTCQVKKHSNNCHYVHVTILTLKFLGTEMNIEKEYGKPTSDRNWGWCSKWCHNKVGPAPAQKLQETQLDILTPLECVDFGQDLNSNDTLEICTGRKTQFAFNYQFRRIVTKSGRVTFKTEGKVENRLGVPKSKYNFYLGGTDSCQGL